MPTCSYCGDDIEFRHVDGRVTPIHLSGGWCSGLSAAPSPDQSGAFRSRQSYVNPNAQCPVCQEPVHFYQSPYGGRVFFDNLGWPWPKHPCTDNSLAQTGQVKRLSSVRNSSFVSKTGEPLSIYLLSSLEENGEGIRLKLSKQLNNLVVINGYLSWDDLEHSDITVDDLQKAPSFVVREYQSFRIIEFISGRKAMVASFKLLKLNR